MKIKTKTVFKSSLVLIVILIAGTLFFAYWKAYKKSLLISCTNHIIQLRYMFVQLPENNLDDGQSLRYNHLPYDKDVPGYTLIPRIWPNLEKNNCRRGLECRHGGWQMLNLPENKMIDLIDTWKKQYGGESPFEDSPPYLWCGKNTGYDIRIALRVDYDKKERKYELFWRNIHESDIQKLNKCLKEIGEEPIPINIPEHIDWKKYF